MVENGERSTVKNDESVEEVQNSVRSDCRLRVRGVENTIGLSYGSVQCILKDDFGMRRVCAKIQCRPVVVETATNNALNRVPYGHDNG